MAQRLLQLRLIYGFSLAGLIIGVLVGDAYLSAVPPPAWLSSALGTSAAAWLCNGALCAGLVGVLVWITTHELVVLARALGYRPFGRLAQLGALALVLVPYVAANAGRTSPGDADRWAMVVLWVVLTLAFLTQARRFRTHGVMINLAATVLLVCYTGGLGCFMTRLRMDVGGVAGIAVLLLSAFVVKMTDVGAYAVGSLLGRTPLIAWLSPKKTWQGFFGGLVVGMIAAVAAGLALRAAGWIPTLHAVWLGPIPLAVFGLVLALLSTAGDLCASLLKRDAAAKDSGQALPGLGGMLDVLDSPLLAMPAAWLYWTQIVGLASAATR